jgi:hypothetical protein
MTNIAQPVLDHDALLDESGDGKVAVSDGDGHIYLRLRRYAAGVNVVRRRNRVVSRLCVPNPAFTATSVSGSKGGSC